MGNQTSEFTVNATIDWCLDEYGLLTINGTGKIPDYTSGNHRIAPWDHDRPLIKSIEIGEGITEIGVNAFQDCRELKEVILPKTLRRIHARAFRNCCCLREIRSVRKKWKYIYDHIDTDRLSEKYSSEGNTVVFGVEAFLNVPWAKRRFGNYYIHDDILYVCFSGQGKCIIPDGVRTLKKFAFSYIKTDNIICPDSLETIEDFTFANTIVREKIVLQDGVKDIGEYAFADCRFQTIHFPEGMVPESMKQRKTYRSDTDMLLSLQRIPELTPRWYVGLKNIKECDRFRRIQVMEKKPIHHKDGTVTSIWDMDYIDVGEAMLRKIQSGGIVFCIIHEGGRLREIKAISMKKVIEKKKEFLIPDVYLMYPVLTQEGELLPWRDSFTYFTRTELVNAFDWENGKELAENRTLRTLNPDVIEEWFFCQKKHGADWGLTLDLLELWHKWNPDIKIDTEDENIERDRYRWFVGI